VHGKAAHAATRQYGVSAIEKFALLLAAISQLEAKRHESFQNDLYDEPRYAAPISIGTVRGGEWHSTVSERVVAEGRMGVFPGEAPETARAALQDTINAVIENDSWLREHPPTLEWFEGQFESGATDPDHPLIQTLAAIHNDVLGSAPLVRGVPYGSDLRLFTNHANIPTVLYGAGDVGLAHGVDEYIVLDDVVEAVKIVAELIVRWCGGAQT
jgi:acetylornithine deacetylase